MPKVTLEKTYLHKGKFYGPGTVDVPDSLAKALTRSTQSPEARTAPATATMDEIRATRTQETEGEERTFLPYRSGPLPTGFPHANRLMAGGVDTMEALSERIEGGSLMQIDGIGDVSARQITEAHAATVEGESVYMDGDAPTFKSVNWG